MTRNLLFGLLSVLCALGCRREAEPPPDTLDTLPGFAAGTPTTNVFAAVVLTKPPPAVTEDASVPEPPPRVSTDPFVQRLEPILRMTANAERWKALQQLSEELETEADILRALGAVDQIKSPTDLRIFVSAVLARWCAFDPAAAAAWLGGTADRMPAIQGVMRTLIGTVAIRWAESDPRAALAWLAEQPEAMNAKAYVGSVLGTWATRDPHAAIEWLNRSDIEETQKPGYLRSILLGWGREDPIAALNYLADLPEDHPVQWLRRNLLTSLARKDPLRALELANEIEDGAMKQSALFQVIQTWGRQNPAAALAYLQKLPAADPLQNLKSTLIVELSKRDVAHALTLLSEIPDDTRRQSALSQIMSIWGRTHPEDALAYLDQFEASDPVHNLRGNIIAALASKDLARAIQLSQTLTDAQGRGRAMQAAALAWSVHDPAAAATWLFDGAIAQPGSAQALNSILREWQWKDDASREAAVKWILDRGTDQPPEVLKVLVERLARADVNLAYEYTQRLPDNESGNAIRGVAYEMIIRELAREDGARAAAMVEASQFDLNPVVIAEVIYNWAGQDPAAAAAWVEKLPKDSSERQRAIADIQIQWSQKDPAAARAWRQRLESAPPAPPHENIVIVE